MTSSENRPKIFVASAREGRAVAALVKQGLGDWADCLVWTDEGIFQPSNLVIEGLEQALDRFSYGVFVMSPEDTVTIRAQSLLAPRDNVIFELGLFVGRHGRRSAFILIPRDSELHLPEDLKGIVPCYYEWRPGTASPQYDVTEACLRIRRSVEELERNRPSAKSSSFWSLLSDMVVVAFGVQHSPEDPPGTHPRISLRDLEAAQTVTSFLARNYPRKRVLTVPVSAGGWQQLLSHGADLVVIGGGVSNAEFARHRDLYQHAFRLKMGRLCRIDGQRVFHVHFARGPSAEGQRNLISPEEVERFPSDYVARDFALVSSRRAEVYGASRRVVSIAGIKGNGTRAAALYLTEESPESSGLDAILPGPLKARDDLEIVLSADIIHDSTDRIDRKEVLEVVLNGKRIFGLEDRLSKACELGRSCTGCAFGEEQGRGEE